MFLCYPVQRYWSEMTVEDLKKYIYSGYPMCSFQLSVLHQSLLQEQWVGTSAVFVGCSSSLGELCNQYGWFVRCCSCIKHVGTFLCYLVCDWCLTCCHRSCVPFGGHSFFCKVMLLWLTVHFRATVEFGSLKSEGMLLRQNLILCLRPLWFC